MIMPVVTKDHVVGAAVGSALTILIQKAWKKWRKKDKKGTDE